MLYFHHVGCIVEDIEEAIKDYSIFNVDEISKVFNVKSQKVKVCFFGEIEFIQPDLDSSLYNFLKKGISFYHIAFKSNDFDNDLEQLLKQNYMLVSDTFNSEAFEFKKCQFVRNNLYHLIEIVQE